MPTRIVEPLRLWPADSPLASIDTLCGAAALETVRKWQAAFEDPRRPEPFCTDRRAGADRGLECTQISLDDRSQISIDVLIPARPSLTSAIVGRPHPATYAALYGRFLARIEAATCP